MSINKNNYEEFLLLYIDGELDDNMSKKVELFIDQNINVKDEFNILLDTKLQQDEVSYGDVSCLLKTEKNEICLNNYEENFLLFIDDELTSKDKISVEKFVLQNPALQTEFITVKNTKLPLEIIKHPYKEELYKKEKKTIVFYLQRLVVAAIFIGVIAFVWNIIGINKKENIVLSNSVNNIKNNGIISLENVLEKSIKKSVSENNNNVLTNNNSINIKVDKNNFPTEKITGTQFNKLKKTTLTYVNNESIKNKILPVIVDKNTSDIIAKNIDSKIEIDKVNTNNTSLNNQPVLNTNNVANSINKNALITTNVLVNTTNNQNNIPAKTIYKMLDTHSDEDKTVLVANTEVSKAKVKGLIKKFTKIFTRKKVIEDDTEKSSTTIL
jgi:hypothetical protein